MSIESPSSPRPSKLSRALRLLITLLILTVLVAGSTAALMRWQWDRNLERTLAWYEDQVGPTDYQSYLPAQLADEDNLAVLLEEAATSWPDSVDRSIFSKFVESYYQLPQAGHDGDATPRALSDLEHAAQSGLTQMAAVIELLDRMAERQQSHLDLPMPWEQKPLPEWLTDSLRLSEAQMTRAALALEENDCVAAAESALVLAKMASILRQEPQLYAQIIGQSIESSFTELAQSLLEQTLVGECDESTSAIQAPIRSARTHLDSSRLPFARVLAAEGSLIANWEIPLTRPLDRLAGRNAADNFASHLVFFAQASRRAEAGEPSLTDGSAEFAQPPPALPAPSRWFSQHYSVAEIYIPNIEHSYRTEQNLRAAQALVDFLLELSDCKTDGSCAAPPPLPTHPVTGDIARTEPTESGSIRVWFPIRDESVVDAKRRSEFSSCEVPAVLLSL